MIRDRRTTPEGQILTGEDGETVLTGGTIILRGPLGSLLLSPGLSPLAVPVVVEGAEPTFPENSARVEFPYFTPYIGDPTTGIAVFQGPTANACANFNAYGKRAGEAGARAWGEAHYYATEDGGALELLRFNEADPSDNAAIELRAHGTDAHGRFSLGGFVCDVNHRRIALTVDDTDVLRIEADAGGRPEIRMVSPDGTLYALSPPNGGGPAVWTAVP